MGGLPVKSAYLVSLGFKGTTADSYSYVLLIHVLGGNHHDPLLLTVNSSFIGPSVLLLLVLNFL